MSRLRKTVLAMLILLALVLTLASILSVFIADNRSFLNTYLNERFLGTIIVFVILCIIAVTLSANIKIAKNENLLIDVQNRLININGNIINFDEIKLIKYCGGKTIKSWWNWFYFCHPWAIETETTNFYSLDFIKHNGEILQCILVSETKFYSTLRTIEKYGIKTEQTM